MGGGCSSGDAIYEHDPKLNKWRKQFEAIQLNGNDIGKLYDVFLRVDEDKSGTIGLVEMLTLMDVENTAFSRRVFSIFDEDHSGKIDFREFVLALWNYCTLSPATLDKFAFGLYDKDSSGNLSVNEIDVMIKGEGLSLTSFSALQSMKMLCY